MKKALILIDYINEIVHENGKTPACSVMFRNTGVADKLNTLLDFAREEQWLIVWIKVCFSEDYIEVGKNSPMFTAAKNLQAYIKDSWGTKIIDCLNYHKEDYVVHKNRVNAFYNTNLDLLLRANGCEELYIAGVSTEMAVQATARDAHDRDYKVNVVGDLCASGNEEFHRLSLAMLARIATVLDTKNIK